MSSHGRFVWYELMTTDTEAAKAFYPPLTGWTTQRFDGPMDYQMWVNAGAPMGGLMNLPEPAKAMGAPPHWQGNIGTDDLDATVALATKLGGKIFHGPVDMPTVGRFAVIGDPHGAAFTAFQSAGTPPGHDGEPRLGEVSWRELLSADAAGAFAFYSALFGWEKTGEMDMGPMGTYHMFGRGGVRTGGMFNKPPQMPVSAWLYYFHVTDVDGKAKLATSRGGVIANGPMDIPGGGRIVQIKDPQGAMFALHQGA